jgi:hypothetical protein
MGIWQTPLSVWPYVPIPTLAILFAWGLVRECVRQDRVLGAAFHSDREGDSPGIRLNPQGTHDVQYLY